jgi:arabinofuranan 3-O-arabinosyltransferase
VAASEEAPTRNVEAPGPTRREGRYAVRISSFEDFLFTERRLSLIGCAFLAGNVISFAIRFFAGSWLIDKAGNLILTDFFQWWIGSQVALSQNVGAVYGFPTFSAAQALATKWHPLVSYYHYVYPPTMLLLFAPIARLPYVTGFFIWMGTTLCLYLLALHEILPSITLLLLALAPLPAADSFLSGGTVFLMAGLLGLSLNLMIRRPYLSGMCLGVLTYKPQFVIFFSLALLATRQWRVIAGAITSATLLAGAVAWVLGPNAWLLYWRVSREMNPATVLPPPFAFAYVNQTVFGLMHQAGAGSVATWGVHLAVALVTTILACLIWNRPVPQSVKAAAFSIGALITTPYMLAYDLAALSVPAAFLLADAIRSGFLPGERLALAGCFLALFLCFQFAVGPFVLLVLMGLVVRRVLAKPQAQALAQSVSV